MYLTMRLPLLPRVPALSVLLLTLSACPLCVLRTIDRDEQGKIPSKLSTLSTDTGQADGGPRMCTCFFRSCNCGYFR